jgi:flagellar motility protein MotE (MotC chaperone)
MKSLRDIRVIPVVLVAVLGLAVLKVAGLVIDGGYVFDYRPNSTKPSWAQESFNFPGGPRVDRPEVTGSVQGAPKEASKDAPKDASKETSKSATAASEPAKPDGVVVYPDPTPQVSASERAILERLQARRQELESRARELEIRESLLKSAEKRIESKVEEMKAVEARISTATGAKNEADAARFKGIVTMYESMKPKDAAKVFDRLEMSVLYEIASQIAPRKMSDILGLMQPEAAERLTIELARRAGNDKAGSSAELPKIEGKMLTPKVN